MGKKHMVEILGPEPPNFDCEHSERIERLVYQELLPARDALVVEFAKHPDIVNHYAGPIADSVATLTALLRRLKIKEVA